MNAPSKDNIFLAVAAIIVAVLALSLGDALIKSMSGNFVLWQIFVVRSALVLPVLIAGLWVWARGALTIPPALGWTLCRSFLMAGMWVAYYLALPHLDLSIAAASYYTAPLFITLFSAALARERIPWLGWVAVALGFVGVLLILRPRAGDFNSYALWPLLAAVLYALAMIVTRVKCRDVHPVVLSVALNLAFLATGGFVTGALAVSGSYAEGGFLIAPWTPMYRAEWLAMGVLSIVILIGSVGAAIAYQKGSPAIVGTFDYSYVGFAVIWGIVFFADVPDALALLGMGLIVAGGVLSLRR